MNRISALYASHPIGYRKYALHEAAGKKTPTDTTDTTAVVMSDRVTLSLEAIRQAAWPSMPLEEQIMPLHSTNQGIYNRRLLGLRR